jgi:hypothetical protein
VQVGGPNQSAVDRIRNVGDILLAELRDREVRREAAKSMPVADAETEHEGSSLPVSAAPHKGWSKQQIVDLMQSGVGENQTLEFKRAASLARDARDISEITKDVSAMANAGGGVLIYGVAEDRSSNTFTLDPVNRALWPREWLEQIVSQIRPRIPGLILHTVEVGASSNEVALLP